MTAEREVEWFARWSHLQAVKPLDPHQKLYPLQEIRVRRQQQSKRNTIFLDARPIKDGVFNIGKVHSALIIAAHFCDVSTFQCTLHSWDAPVMHAGCKNTAIIFKRKCVRGWIWEEKTRSTWIPVIRVKKGQVIIFFTVILLRTWERGMGTGKLCSTNPIWWFHSSSRHLWMQLLKRESAKISRFEPS